MIKIFLLVLCSLLSLNCFSQDLNTQNNNTQNSDEIPKDIKYSLDDNLKNQNYESFYKLISSSKLSDKSIIHYLNSKSNEGHIPVYWLLSEYNAKIGNVSDAHKWFYIALITTQQDSYLCVDETSKNAPRILIKYFNNANNLTNKTPQYIEQAMKETSFFIDNLQNRTNPKWVCNYGDNPVVEGQNPLIEPSLWNKTRKQVYLKFIDKYQK